MILSKEQYKQIENQLYRYSEGDINGEWKEVIEQVINHFIDTIHGKIIELNYFQQYRITKIFTLLAIEKTTYYDLRQDIIYYAAFKAQDKGLIKVD